MLYVSSLAHYQRILVRAALIFQLGIALLPASQLVLGAESDQFSERTSQLRNLPDHTAQVDAWINLRLERLRQGLRPWQDHRERLQMARELFLLPIVPDLLSYIEQWLLDAQSPVETFRPGKMGIFSGVSPTDARMVYVFGLDPTLKLAGQLVGTDKIGHFFSQGFQYYIHFLNQQPSLSENDRIESLRELGYEQESGYLGLGTDGVFSRADLASNWAGFEFWDALFDGDQAYFRFSRQNRTWVQTRTFAFRDFVTPAWDEYLNPPLVRSRAMQLKLQQNISEICKNPDVRKLLSEEAPPPVAPTPYLLLKRPEPGFAIQYGCKGAGHS
ncbi:MAG: hypothetical protein AAB425_02600 [Bdellovibrionota bacterium]